MVLFGFQSADFKDGGTRIRIVYVMCSVDDSGT